MDGVQSIRFPVPQACVNDCLDNAAILHRNPSVLNDILAFLKEFEEAQDDRKHDAVIQMSKAWFISNCSAYDNSNETSMHTSHHRTDFEVTDADTWATEQITYIPKWLDQEDLIGSELNDGSKFSKESYITAVHTTSAPIPCQVSIDIDPTLRDGFATGTNDPDFDATASYISGTPSGRHTTETDGDTKEPSKKPSTAHNSLYLTYPPSSRCEKKDWVPTNATPELDPMQLEGQLLSTYETRGRSNSLSLTTCMMRLLLAWQMILTWFLLCSKQLQYMQLTQSNPVVVDITLKVAIGLNIATIILYNTTHMVPHAWRRWFLTLLVFYMLLVGVFTLCSLSRLRSQAALVMKTSDALLLNILNLWAYLVS